METLRRPTTHSEIQDFRHRTLVEATLDCLADGGLENATVRKISDAAGASRGLIGHHFGGRERLLVEAHEYLCASVEAVVLKLASMEGLTDRERLQAVPRAIFSEEVLTERRARAFLALWHAVSVYPDIRKNHERLYEGYRRQLSEVFELARQAGAPVADPHLAAFSLIALIDGLWLQTFLERKISRADAVRACLHYIDFELGFQASIKTAPG